MNHATSIGITRRLIAHVIADTTDLAEAPRIEPVVQLWHRRWEEELS